VRYHVLVIYMHACIHCSWIEFFSSLHVKLRVICEIGFLHVSVSVYGSHVFVSLMYFCMYLGILKNPSAGDR
jgi:hypothetical protein